MNRLKKEIRRKGVKLELDYPFLPFNGLECVKVDSEKATISEYHVCAGWCVTKICHDLTFENIYDDRLFG